MLAYLKKLFASQAATPPPLDLQDPATDEYLDLMLEWGTIADIPNLVRGMRKLKDRVRELEAELGR